MAPGVTSWRSLFGERAVAVAPSDKNIVWVGAGEANPRNSVSYGDGVYKSTDGGKTWTNVGLKDTQHIGRMVIHPKNPDIVYVAALGHLYSDNDERGVFKTIDGGKTWRKALYGNPRTGAIDLVMDPVDPNTLYAAMWQRIRFKWNDPRTLADYTGSGIFKTTDAGKTWTPINQGLPDAKFRGRIGLDVSRSKPNIVYAFLDNYDVGGAAQAGELDAYGRPAKSRIKGAEVYRSEDKGKTWRKVSEPDPPAPERGRGGGGGQGGGRGAAAPRS